jgi:hypothetical protein
VTQIYQRFKDQAEFVTIYIKEAHPTDEWQMDSNEKEGVCYAQPRTFEQRLAIARDFTRSFDFPIPMFVDGIDNRADSIYAGWPERFYILDERGKIAFKGKPGPFGYDPAEVETWLLAHGGSRR